MRRILLKRNDYGDASFEDVVPELARCGIITSEQFPALMTKHRRQLLQIDRDPLATREIRIFAEDDGRDFIAATLEFGDEAFVYVMSP